MSTEHAIEFNAAAVFQPQPATPEVEQQLEVQQPALPVMSVEDFDMVCTASASLPETDYPVDYDNDGFFGAVLGQIEQAVTEVGQAVNPEAEPELVVAPAPAPEPVVQNTYTPPSPGMTGGM